ncbi:MAG: hypothetical protein IAI49_03160 [Candidatus Eremiobacteraeota bacterium]|nr:hypothetical protein [Candidatus Eremiobacteraeota bacterium]
MGLNTVVTLRQNTGSSVGTSVLSNAPTITGPTGFKIPGAAAAPDAYGDAGTNHISGFIPTSLASPPPQTTFDPDADGAQGNYLASSWGFFPGVVANSGDTPSLTPGAMPFYSANNSVLAGAPLEYIGGPPAFQPPGHTSTQDGTFPSGYAGYTLGIADFQTVPVSGTYALNVVIPTGVNTSTGVSSFGTKTASSTIAAGTVLPAWTVAPTFVPDGTGGGTITTNFAGGGGVTEEFIELVNDGPSSCAGSGSGPYYYTFEVTSGTATVTVPDNIGPALPGHAQPHTFCTAAENGATAGEDSWSVYGFAVDYPLLEAGFPASTGVAAPAIKTGTQDDITTSAASAGGPLAASIHRKMQRTYTRHR